MTNEAAERLRYEMGSAYRIDLLDKALAHERKATVKALWPFLSGHGPYCRSSFLGHDPKCSCGLSAILGAAR